MMFDRLKSYRHPVKEEELSAHLDGRLLPARARRLEEHLRSCDPCRRKLAGLRTLAAALREMPEAPLPRFFALTPEPVRGIRQVRPYAPAGRLYPVLRNAAAAAAVLLFAVVGADIFLNSHGGGVEPAGSMLSAEKEVEVPGITSGAASDEEKSERNTFGQSDATPHDVIEGLVPPAVPVPVAPGTPLPGAESTPLLVLSPAALATPLPGETLTPPPSLALTEPGTPPAPEADRAATVAETEEDRLWLRALEGILGGLALGLLAVAFFVRRRSRRI